MIREMDKLEIYNMLCANSAFARFKHFHIMMTLDEVLSDVEEDTSIDEITELVLDILENDFLPEEHRD